MEEIKLVYDEINFAENNKNISLQIKRETCINLEKNDPIGNVLAYLDKSFSQNTWKFSTDKSNNKSNALLTDFKSAALSILELLYGYSLRDETFSYKFELNTHLLNLKSCSFNEKCVQLEYEISGLKNLYEVLLYSPRAIDSSNEKILFIFYQLLMFYQYLHSINLNCAELKLSDIYIDENYWIKVKLPIEAILGQYAAVEPTNNELDKLILKKNKSSTLFHDEQDSNEFQESSFMFYLFKENLIHTYNSYKHLSSKDLAEITKKWCHRKISNFDYLLIMNCIAGRELNSPFNHPIFPWITDFESFNTNLRDLSVSKFRLNKGDALLDLNYQASMLGGTGPYHLTEFLSEITYFVYKSRLTDKETLCKHVRRNWVPNEYPSSMTRLFFWTPEECIPEFYCDVNIFKSIHEDLPDLKVPDWCNDSVEEFIRMHRMLLESDAVSRKLNHWIDLIFGFKLSGEAAVEAKNVCLPLIDNHQNMKTHGIVQLFFLPHPVKSIDQYYHSDAAPIIINRSRIKTDNIFCENLKVKYSSVSNGQEAESARKKTISKAENEILNTQIVLPDDYNPFAQLDQVESLLKFTNKAYRALPQVSECSKKRAKQNFEDLCDLDLKCVVCLLTEIVFFGKLKCLPQRNPLQNRHLFISQLIIQEPHVLSGPFAPLILSVLKPFGALDEKLSNQSGKRASKCIFYENLQKSQTSFVSFETLLNPILTVLPLKHYFDKLYKFGEIFNKLNCLIKEFESIKQINSHMVNFIRHVESLISGRSEERAFKRASIAHSLAGADLDSNRSSRSTKKGSENTIINENTESVVSDDGETTFLKIESLHEKKFAISSIYLQSLMVEMSDPRKNHLAQSICFPSDSFELVLPYLINLFEEPNSCVDALLQLLKKVHRFLSRAEMVKKFLPIILHLMNVVDLGETIGIELGSLQNKAKFCKLFDFSFINELRIIFGLQIFLVQICPFLIEAISGFKDFDLDADSLGSSSVGEAKENAAFVGESKTLNPASDIFYMEGERSLTGRGLMTSDDAKSLSEEDKSFELSESIFNKSPKFEKFTSVPNDLASRKYVYFNELIGSEAKEKFAESDETSVFECDRESLEGGLDSNRAVNISSTAFTTFTKLIQILGAVLTCKYCCADLLKMLAICYMNTKCLCSIERPENPLNSMRPIEGDRFASLILQSLKSVASLYGEQVVVLQYLPHVYHTVAACVNKLTNRLEASLIAGVVLIGYFVSYIDIKSLMDNLNEILSQVVIPVIGLYSNEKIKFPNGYLMRQVIAYKVLDIILLLSLRIGPEQTRIEMGRVIKAFFEGFSLVHTNVMGLAIPVSKPLRIEHPTNQGQTPKNNSLKNSLKPRASIAFAPLAHQKAVNSVKDNILLSSGVPGILDLVAKESFGDETNNSFDEYLKYSYDQSTNEIVGSSLKASNGQGSKRLSTATAAAAIYKFRSHSIGLLSLNSEENEANSASVTAQNSVENESTLADLSTLEINNSGYLDTKTIFPENLINEEILNTFTSELANTAYFSISRLNSGVYIDSILPNAELIHRMCKQEERQQKMLTKFTSQPNLTSKSFISRAFKRSDERKVVKPNDSYLSSSYNTSYGASFSENVGVVSNQIQINERPLGFSESSTNLTDSIASSNAKFVLKFNEHDLKEAKANIDCSRHLSENWLAYWENEIRSNDKSTAFDFKHINLLTLNGHLSAVKCMVALDNESSIISGSKDKTVKLWSIKNQGSSSNAKKNVQNCQWSYSGHKKPVFNLLFIESMRVCASCDGTIHVWDPFVGKKLFQLENQLVTCITSLAAPAASFVAATADNSTRFIDLRSKSFAYEFRTCYAPSGTIRSMSTSEHLLLVGFSTGLMCLLDMRNGWIVESWKTYDNEIQQLKFTGSDQFACSYSDGSVAFCSTKDKVQLKNILKMFNEPVPFMCLNENQLITASGTNKIGIFSNIDKPSQINCSINKLQSESFKGFISSLNYLPLNRLLLLGADNGDIKVIC